MAPFMLSGPGLSGKILGRYHLGSLLGRGGMGEVYRADDSELRRPVALKVLPASFTADPDRLARFIQEARTASALNHPHLVAIYEVGDATPEGASQPVHFIAMELVQGETLRQVFDNRRGDLKRTLEYLAQAADALAAAHGAGIVHRDLKPENLMIAQGGYAKVLDFGLAKLRAESAPAVVGDGATVTGGRALPGGGTSPGVVMGTVGYMPPEQAQGLPVDHRSDIFSFGCILYEAATGARPFAGASAVDTLHQIIHVQPPSVGQLAPTSPYELQRIVRKCLAKSPDERYQTMKDVALDLRELRRELESGSSPTAAILPGAQGRGSQWSWPIAALLAIAVVAVVSYGLWRDGERSDLPRQDLALERITTSGLVIDAVISADGNYLAYVESEGGVQKLQLRQIKGTRPLELLSRTGAFWGIEFSRDSSSIYFAIKSPEEPLGVLQSIPLLGGTPKVLASGIDSREVVTGIRPAGVAISPDGRSLVYAAERDNTGAIWRANLDGSNERRLADVADAFWLAVAPDGRHVYFTSSRGGSPATYRVALDGGEIALVAAGLQRAVPSPDGRLLAGIYRDSPRSPLTIGVLDAADDRRPRRR